MINKDDIRNLAALLYCNDNPDCSINEAMKAADDNEDYRLNAESILFTLYANGWRKCAPPDDTFRNASLGEE